MTIIRTYSFNSFQLQKKTHYVKHRQNGRRVDLHEIMKSPAQYISRLIEDDLLVKKRHGKLRNTTSMIYGIPTVSRNREDYLNDTLDSVFSDISNTTGVVRVLS